MRNGKMTMSAKNDSLLPQESQISEFVDHIPDQFIWRRKFKCT